MCNWSDSKPLEDFNWEEFERGMIQQNISQAEYDEDPIFEQGIAIVQRNGKYGAIMVGGKEIVPPIYDALTKFTDGLAKVKYKDDERMINLSGQIQVNRNNKPIFIPERYDWGFDFVNDVCIVIKDNKFGAINNKFGVIIECEYTFYENFKNGFAIIGNNKTTIIINDKAEECYKIINSFSDGEKIIEERSKSQNGVMNSNMEIVIPVLYNHIKRLKSGYYMAESGEKEKMILSSSDGSVVSKITFDKIENINDYYFTTYLIDEEGEICETSIYNTPEKPLLTIPYEIKVYPCKENSVQFSLNGLQYECDAEGTLYIIAKKIKYCPSQWNYRWEKVVPRKVSHTYVKYIHSSLSKEYEIIEDNQHLKGVSNFVGDTIIEPQYNFIRYAYRDLFIVAKPNPNTDGKTLVFGAVDKLNIIKIPFEYECLIPIDDKYIAYAEGHIYNVNDNNEYWIMDFPSSGHYDNITFGILGMDGEKVSNPIFSKISGIKNGSCFIVGVEIKVANQQYSTIKYGIIDSKGDYMVMPKYEQISEVEELRNGFLKVTYHKGECGSSHIGILNNLGETVFEKYNCDDIVLLDHGFFLVKGSPTTYSLANLQGKEILSDSYYEIKIINDGMISIRDCWGWGLADLKGNIIIDTNYLDELVFVDGAANIKVKGSSSILKINKKGIVTVHNGKNEIELPHSVYWGTDFINRVSIVRGKGGGHYVIGVVDVKGNMIIPTQYKSICLLSNKTIRVQDGDCYGIFDLKGNTIFPPIFTSIEYIGKDRIKVTWNLTITTKWDRKDYIPAPKNKYKGHDIDYYINNRSAICNFNAEIVNDKEIIGVGKFINGYARAYKDVTLEKGRILSKQVGVIDVSGRTVIPHIYDDIIISENSQYIIIRKGRTYGIANLESGTTKMFNQLDIKHMWDIDNLGRCIYSDDCEYDDDSEDWIGGTRGVLTIKGILVPTGKYHDITLIDNGLIKVSNEKGDLCGLLNKQGNEILPIQYSYISSFKGNLAIICKNGKRDDEWPYRIRGGKWGVIDSTGKFVKECLSDEAEVLEEKEYDYKRTDNNVQFEEPSVVLSDRIPESKERNSYDYSYDSFYDDDNDGSYSKYGGYNGWDDNTIDEAFDGNPELTWNID